MGMFDEIIYKATCHQCGEPLSEFQSKSGDNVLARLTPRQLYEVTKSNTSKLKIYGIEPKVIVELPVFYTYCPKCGSREEFVIKPGRLRKLRIIPVKSNTNV